VTYPKIEKKKSGRVVMGDLPKWRDGRVVMGDLPRQKNTTKWRLRWGPCGLSFVFV